MSQPATGAPSDQKFPPAINIIALASFSAALSTRALDPVLPHVAEDFSISITTAASIAAGYALIYALVQPVIVYWLRVPGIVATVLSPSYR